MRSLRQRLVAALAAAWLVSIAPAHASQATLVTPSSPLPMSSLATFLNGALLSIGSCNSGNSAPANGAGAAAFAGECWIDTAANPLVFYVTPDGTNWVETGTLNTSTKVWTPYFGGSPVAATSPLTSTLSGGIATLALSYDGNFTNNGSNQLAFANIASGDLLANAGSGSAEPTATTPSAWFARWCSSTQYQFPQAGTSSSWACNTIGNLIAAGTGISFSGTGQVTIGLTSQITAAGPIGGAAIIPVLTYNAQGQLTAVTTATANPTQVNGNSWPSSGTSGGIPYFSAANTISSSGALTQYGFVFGGGSGGAPTGSTACTDAQIPIGQSSGAPACKSTSGDVTIADTGAHTIAANAVSNAKLATAGANTVKANPTGSTANEQDVSPATARSASLLDIDELTKPGDANYTILNTDRKVAHTALSAARTDTLPAASSLNPGQTLDVIDHYGVATSSNTITVAAAGSDTINGVSSFVAINSQYGGVTLKSDGVSKWSYVPASSGGGSGTVTQVTPGAGISSTPAAGGTTPITSTGTLYDDASYHANYLGGLVLSNDGTSPNSVLDIEAGVATDSTNVYFIKIGAFTKSTAGAWASGSGANGMGNGLTVAVATWYHVCLAYNGASPDIWFDTSVTCADRPSGISGSYYRRIGSFKTDASAHILAFSQNGDEFLWKTPIADVSAVASSATAASYALSVPPGVEVWALGSANIHYVSAIVDCVFYALDMGTQAANTPNGYFQLYANASIVNQAGNFQVRTNTSASIGLVANAAGGTINWLTYGWIDQRGKLN